MGFLDSLFSAFGGSGSNENKSASAAPQAGSDKTPFAPVGCSYGERMPDEPNQFNYMGSYEQYFESVFADKLRAYRMEKVNGKWKNTIYTFYNETSKVLVVELLSETSSTRKVRNDCENERVPYLRFYYNHHGWWNTRSYVEGRIDGALK